MSTWKMPRAIQCEKLKEVLATEVKVTTTAQGQRSVTNEVG